VSGVGAVQQQAYYASSESVEWYTPPHIWQRAVQVLGAIDCDPCSNPPPYNVPAAVHYTKDDDGLAQPWRGTVWMNPPFGAGIGDWLTKLETEYQIGRCTAAIALTPGRTEARWFQTHWRSAAVCFVLGRVQFLGAKQSGNTTGTVISYWGSDAGRFADVFSPLGQIIYPNARYQARAVQPALWEVPA
jgi:hypothetical protein